MTFHLHRVNSESSSEYFLLKLKNESNVFHRHRNIFTAIYIETFAHVKSKVILSLKIKHLFIIILSGGTFTISRFHTHPKTC